MRKAAQRILTILILLPAFVATACSAKIVAETTLTKFPQVKTDKPVGMVLTVVRVKTPIYGVRSLLVGGFKQSVPEYKALKGLTYKIYILSPDNKVFGGIYLWQSEKDARNWFNAAWDERVEKKYGAKGTIDYYQVTAIKCVAQTSANEGAFWAVLSLAENPIRLDETAVGLIGVVDLRDANDYNGFLTLWHTRADAERYFAHIEADNTFFDAPVLLDNTK